MSPIDGSPFTTLPTEHATIMEQPSTCRLLALPVELRERIYRYALEQSWPGYRTLIWSGKFSGKRSWTQLFPSQHVIAPLLATCRQIRRESETIFYQSNPFTFADSSYQGVSVDLSACKKYAPHIPHMRHIQIVVDDVRFHLTMQRGLEQYRFWVASGNSALRRNISMKRWRKLEQSEVDEFVANVEAKGRHILDVMAEGAVLCGEAPVISINGVRELMEMIFRERVAADSRREAAEALESDEDDYSRNMDISCANDRLRFHD